MALNCSGVFMPVRKPGFFSAGCTYGKKYGSGSSKNSPYFAEKNLGRNGDAFRRPRLHAVMHDMTSQLHRVHGDMKATGLKVHAQEAAVHLFV